MYKAPDNFQKYDTRSQPQQCTDTLTNGLAHLTLWGKCVKVRPRFKVSWSKGQSLPLKVMLFADVEERGSSTACSALSLFLNCNIKEVPERKDFSMPEKINEKLLRSLGKWHHFLYSYGLEELENKVFLLCKIWMWSGYL